MVITNIQASLQNKKEKKYYSEGIHTTMFWFNIHMSNAMK